LHYIVNLARKRGTIAEVFVLKKFFSHPVSLNMVSTKYCCCRKTAGKWLKEMLELADENIYSKVSELKFIICFCCRTKLVQLKLICDLIYNYANIEQREKAIIK